jgi:hypothetical protein
MPTLNPATASYSQRYRVSANYPKDKYVRKDFLEAVPFLSRVEAVNESAWSARGQMSDVVMSNV